MPEIIEETSGKTIVCELGANLMQVLTGNGIYVNNPCNGKGICGKCKVQVLKGNVSGEQPEEAEKLSEKERQQGYRLACMVQVTGDCRIRACADTGMMQVLTHGVTRAFAPDPDQSGYGVAVDIGTTTIAMSLVDLSNGETLAKEAGMNGQRAYGQDVLTRITYEMEHDQKGIRALQEAVVESVNQGIASLCGQIGIDKDEIVAVSVAGNCTMIHMFLGVDARSIGVAPYRPAFLQAQCVPATGLGLLVSPEAKVYCLAQVSGYIGGDILAGAYVCDLLHSKKNTLFIDIGTNGEMILSRKGKLSACSCAAGPALEGMNITCGMPALPGAMESIVIREDGINYDTIGGKPPRGICGSGILEGVSELIRTGLIRPTGAFVKPEKLAGNGFFQSRLVKEEDRTVFYLDREHEVSISQQDVRQVQLAKGAILSGLRSLIGREGLKEEDLDEVLIAGQFGSHLSAEALAGAGLIPRQLQEKVRYVGNTSQTGACMALLSETVRQDMEQLAKQIEYFELAESEGYQELFIESMRFPSVGDK